jgi:AcrR family transcriptional regulator
MIYSFHSGRYKSLLNMLQLPVKHYIAVTMEISSSSVARRTGRPLSFDRDAALRTAMHLFWQHGFEGTSVAALTQAMGIAAPSLYAAFGDKQRLFRESVDCYLGGIDAITRHIEAAPSAQQATRDLLTAAALGDTGDETPAGCLVASSIVSCSSGADQVRKDLADIRRAIEAALRSRIGRDVANGTLPADCDPEMLAGHAFSVVQGMSTLAKDGASRGKLLKIVDAAMACWPAAEKAKVR